MSRRGQAILLFSGLLLLIAGVAFMVLSRAYSPEIRHSQIGGKWETTTTRTFGGTSWGHTALYRSEDGVRSLVAPIVFKESYVGDDCVFYGTLESTGGSACWIACDDRLPSLVARPCARWELVDQSFHLLESTSQGVEVVSELSISDLKSSALESPQAP